MDGIRRRRIASATVQGFAFYRSPKRKLDAKLRELGQIRAGYARGSRFVFSQHCKACRDVGLSEEQIQAIPAWAVASCFSASERAVLAYTDCLVLEGGRVPDALFAELRRHLDDAEILELTYVTCMYEMHATMSRALRWSSTTSTSVTECRSDAGAGAADVMSMVDATKT